MTKKRRPILLLAFVVVLGVGGVWLANSNRSAKNRADVVLTSLPELANLSADGDRSAKLLAAGDWSEPVRDAAGYLLRGRLLLYDTPHYTNDFPNFPPTEFWGNNPLFLEVENLTSREGKPLAVYFAVNDGLECELRDAQGRMATNNPQLMYNGPSTPWTRQYWVTVPCDGSVRLRADPQLGGTSPRQGQLVILMSWNSRWVIPAGETNSFFLSGNFSPPTNHPPPPGSHVWSGKLVLPPVKISPSRK